MVTETAEGEVLTEKVGAIGISPIPSSRGLMVKIEWYNPLGIDHPTQDSIRLDFLDSLILSNRDPSFFVDWTKVHRNLAERESALSKLSLAGRQEDARSSLVELLVAEPAVASVLPLMFAWRTTNWNVLHELGDGRLSTLAFDFSGRSRLNKADAERMVQLCDDTGILHVITSGTDLRSYLLGVEVGMDTNARKNRSGTFMEHRMNTFVEEAVSRNPGWRVWRQKTFAEVARAGVPVPAELLARKFDYAFTSRSRKVTMEVNYYDKEGSKPQEIVDSYINRASELRREGWEFVWVTDGPCWRGDTPQIRKAFSSLDAVLNLNLCQRGVLDRILLEERDKPDVGPPASPRPGPAETALTTRIEDFSDS